MKCALLSDSGNLLASRKVMEMEMESTTMQEEIFLPLVCQLEVSDLLAVKSATLRQIIASWSVAWFTEVAKASPKMGTRMRSLQSTGTVFAL